MGKLAALSKALDMSKEARMARAREMGFDTDTVYYHGTQAGGFNSFDLSKTGSQSVASKGVYFSPDRSVAETYSGDLNDVRISNEDSKTAGIYPVYLRTENPLKFDFDGAYFDGTDPFKHPTWEELELNKKPFHINEAANLAASKGHDSLIVDNVKDPGRFVKGYMDPSTTVAVFDPKNIRSVNAAFDPAKKDSSNLLAGVTGATVSAGALLPEEAAADFTQRRATKKDQWKQLREQLFGPSPIDYMGGPVTVPQQRIEAPKSQTLLDMARGAQAYNDFVDKPLINLVAPKLPAELWRKQAYGQPTTLGERSWAALEMLP